MTKCNLWNLRKLIAPVILIVFSCGATWAQAALPLKKITVAYFGQSKAEDFELKIKPVFADKVRSCKGCELVNFTPYAADGSLDVSALKDKIESLPATTSFVFFDFNLKVNDANKELIEALNKKAESGMVFVGTAGAPNPSEASGPLSRTILGQVRSAIIIGELAERDRLMPSGFYGPEMLTAIRPPKEMLGQGFSPLLFAAALAENWPKRSSTEWVEHMRTKKMKSRKIWLDIGDIF